MVLRIVLGTSNRGKIREIREILSNTGIELAALDEFPPFPEPVENGKTFLENAMIKAKAVHAATGLPALADDSGIEVDALGGAPGIMSARYGGEGLSDAERGMFLLDGLKGKDENERSARFRCVMVLYPVPGEKDGAFVTEGIFEGRIAERPSGDNGFGYDPVFFVPEEGMTAAEMDISRKNSISHRYRALVEMKGLLQSKL